MHVGHVPCAVPVALRTDYTIPVNLDCWEGCARGRSVALVGEDVASAGSLGSVSFVISFFFFGPVGNSYTWIRDTFMTWDVGVFDPSKDVLTFGTSVVATLE